MIHADWADKQVESVVRDQSPNAQDSPGQQSRGMVHVPNSGTHEACARMICAIPAKAMIEEEYRVIFIISF